MERTSRRRDNPSWRGSGGPRQDEAQDGGVSQIVRRLVESDRAALHRLLAAEPGYSLFLTSNLSSFGLDAAFVRYWGAFVNGELTAALMMVGRRAAIYAPPGADVGPLARTAALLGATFSMGRRDLVDAFLAACGAERVTRREEHYLAAFEPGGDTGHRLAHVVERAGTVVRRATGEDLERVTRLYLGTDGFETLTEDQVRRTMSGRIHSLRTFIAEVAGELVAGASTSAETPDAAMIGGVWTAPGARNRGYASAVVAALTRELVEERRRPYLFYLVENVAAAHVYDTVGYHMVGPWSIVYLRGEQA